MNVIVTREYESPCGGLLLGAYGDRLCLCDWQVERHRGAVDRRLQRMLGVAMVDGGSAATEGTLAATEGLTEAIERESAVLDRAAAQLDEYFAGQRREFDVPLLFVGTDFQKRVWTELLNVPFGTTVSYGEMARRIGMPTAVRAVANANGANSISIFAPCHRVIGSDNSLTGYGGGLEAKRWLLELEGFGAFPLARE